MKSETVESPKKLLTGPESAEIYDFLYVDRSRISALYAQLFPQGILTAVKTTAAQSFSDDSNVGTDIKVFKAEAKTVEGGSRGIEHMFDASWSIPLEVLARLKSLSLVRDSLKGGGLGSIVLTDCHLRVIDFESMDKLWEPGMKIAFASGPQSDEGVSADAVPVIAEVMKATPRSIHAHFLTNDAFLWSQLQPANLTIPTSDLTLKYGGTVSGSWKLLYILDAWADAGDPPDTTGWSGGQLIDAVLNMMHQLKTLMGRPSDWIGITPLMIFRSISGWVPGARLPEDET